MEHIHRTSRLIMFVGIAVVVVCTAASTSTAEPDRMAPYPHRGQLRGTGRVLAQYYNPRMPLTCSANPSICSGAASGCCQNQCVDLGNDITNCGQCGRWCGYGQSCCRGSCVSLLFDTNNCGSCGNKCRSGSQCTYGMCSYA